jgi:hypothetical protein
MSSFNSKQNVLVSTMLAALCAAPASQAAAQQKAAPPDFSSSQFGWVGVGGGFGVGGAVFSPVAGQLPPLTDDPAHRFVPNGAKSQPTYRIADLSNPNLKPWVKEHMAKDNEEVLAGRSPSRRDRAACRRAFLALWPMGDRRRFISFKHPRKSG